MFYFSDKRTWVRDTSPVGRPSLFFLLPYSTGVNFRSSDSESLLVTERVPVSRGHTVSSCVRVQTD